MDPRTFFYLPAALLSALLLSSACAANEQHFPSGVWKGTIGTAAVMTCLTESGDSQYYYLRHQLGINLILAGGGNNTTGAAATAWQTDRLELEEQVGGNGEANISGHWLLEAKSANELIGTWRSPNGAKTVPIRLSKVVANGRREAQNPDTCAQSYLDPIRASARLKYLIAKFGERNYRTVSSDQGTSFEVPPDTPHPDKVNRYALDWLRNQSVVAYDCSSNLGRLVEPLGSSLQPVVWTDQYLVLQDLMPDTFCGGAHGNSSLAYLTWSVPQGKLIDTWAWLQGGQKALVAHAGKQGRAIPSGLFRLIAKAHPRNTKGDDCSEVIDQMSVQSPYPTAQGLVFGTDFFHAMRACNDAVQLDWKQLAPYLSEEGRVVIDNWLHSGH